MLGRTVGILPFTACALRASAFLLPPNVDISEVETSLFDVARPVNAQSSGIKIELPCSDCVFPNRKEEDILEDTAEPRFWAQGGANNIHVHVASSADRTRILINGEPVYPPGLGFSPRISVMQVPAATTDEDWATGKTPAAHLEVTADGLSIMEEEVVSDEGHVIIPIRYMIRELESQPVTLDAVLVRVMRTPQGELHITGVNAVENPLSSIPELMLPNLSDEEDSWEELEEERFSEDMTEPHWFPVTPEEFEESQRMGRPHFHPHEKCNMLPAPLCNLKNMIESKVSDGRKGGCHGMKGSRPHMGKLPGHIKPHFFRPDGTEVEDMDDMSPPPFPPHHHGRPHHMRPHGGHHNGPHHGHHHFMHAFSRGLAAVLIPTMAGVAVGMAVSLVGLLLGRLIGFMWIKLYRGGRRGYASVALDESHVGFDERKEAGSEEDVEPLPVYEEAPAYEENAGAPK